MLIVRLYGGMGNQLFQFATGYSIAKRLNCEIKLDISFFSNQSFRKFSLDRLNIDIKYASMSEIKKFKPLSFISRRLFKRFKFFQSNSQSYLVEPGDFIFDERIMTCQSPVYIDGYWQNIAYFNHLREDLQAMYKPSREFGKEYCRYLELIKNNQSVCLHVRRGDYVQNSKTRSVHYVCDKSYYRRSIAVIDKKIKSPFFFIFSDDISWCKNHFAFLDRKVFINNLTSLEEEFDLMRNCHSHIISNSTFSWWASWLASTKESRVIIFPDKWIKNSKKDPNLYFSKKILRL